MEIRDEQIRKIEEMTVNDFNDYCCKCGKRFSEQNPVMEGSYHQGGGHKIYIGKCCYINLKSLEPKVEICICAAVYDKLGDIWRGHRHGDCMETMLRCGRKPSGNSEHQGFITSSNRYVTREEGRKLQDEAGIKSADKESYRGNTLFSEDLY